MRCHRLIPAVMTTPTWVCPASTVPHRLERAGNRMSGDRSFSRQKTQTSNEAHRTHDLHARFCMEVYGAHRLNKSTRGRLMDCDKGSLRTHKERYPLTQWMACSWHRSDGVQRHCGVAQKEFFVEAVNALTQAQVAAAKSKMSDKGKAYVNATFRKECVYVCIHTHMYTRMSL